jgi:hypothetical protein
MSDQYDHALRSDQRYRAAQATNQSRPISYHVTPEPSYSSWWLVGVGAIIVALALVFFA